MNLKTIQQHSKVVLNFWNTGARGWAPKEVSQKLEAARIDWLLDLTECLTIWNNKGNTMTNGELILAYANLGALVEGWLKLFYCIYYIDYCRNPLREGQGSMIEPNNLKFEKLKQFSRNILWDKCGDWDVWVTKIQNRRNAIHSFNDKEIGTPIEYFDDIDTYRKFILLIDARFLYPEGEAY